MTAFGIPNHLLLIPPSPLRPFSSRALVRWLAGGVLCAAPSSDWEHIASFGSKSESVVPSRGNSEVQGCQRTGIQDEVCGPPERKLPDVEVCGVRDRNQTPDGLDGAVPHHMNTRQ